MAESLYIRNRGQEIAETNYWQTRLNSEGVFILSSNAGALRLMVPDPHRGVVRQVRDTRLVVVSRGPMAGVDTLEILFDDDTQEPYSIHMEARAATSLPSFDDPAALLSFTVWTHRAALTGRKRQSFPCRLRRSASLPDLRPWRQP